MSDVDLAARLYSAFGDRNIGAVFAGLHRDVVWRTHAPGSPFHGVHRGVGGVQAYMDRMSHVTLERFEIQALDSVGDRVVALIDVRRTTKATRAVVEGQFVHVLRFEGGRLREIDVYEPNAETGMGR